MKRVVVIGDIHAGHRAGLTPPEWQYKRPYEDRDARKYADIQQKLWNMVAHWAKKLQPVYALIHNGDAIEGPNERNQGRELLTSDRMKQAEIAAQGIKIFKPKHILMTYGTPYHTGRLEDWEDLVAQKLGAPPPRDRLWTEIGKVLFDVRHYVGRSVIPHGRATPVLRQVLWEQLWADWEERKAAHVTIRHHVHYHLYAGSPGVLAMTGPALQAYSHYGVRHCDGIVHMGLVWFDIDEREGKYRWESQILKGRVLKSEPIKL